MLLLMGMLPGGHSGIGRFLLEWMVNSIMFSIGNYLKVFNFIIESISIDMMDLFLFRKRSLQMFFHYPSVFFYGFFTNPNCFVWIFRNVPFSIFTSISHVQICT